VYKWVDRSAEGAGGAGEVGGSGDKSDLDVWRQVHTLTRKSYAMRYHARYNTDKGWLYYWLTMRLENGRG
jgi:hypothetical protein